MRTLRGNYSTPTRFLRDQAQNCIFNSIFCCSVDPKLSGWFFTQSQLRIVVAIQIVSIRNSRIRLKVSIPNSRITITIINSIRRPRRRNNSNTSSKSLVEIKGDSLTMKNVITQVLTTLWRWAWIFGRKLTIFRNFAIFFVYGFAFYLFFSFLLFINYFFFMWVCLELYIFNFECD